MSLSMRSLKKKIRDLKIKIAKERILSHISWTVVAKKLRSPWTIAAAAASSAVIGWFSFRKIAKLRRAHAAKHDLEVSRVRQSKRNFFQNVAIGATVISTVSAALGTLFAMHKKNKRI